MGFRPVKQEKTMAERYLEKSGMSCGEKDFIEQIMSGLPAAVCIKRYQVSDVGGPHS